MPYFKEDWNLKIQVVWDVARGAPEIHMNRLSSSRVQADLDCLMTYAEGFSVFHMQQNAHAYINVCVHVFPC